MFEMTNENLERLFKGLTIAVGHRTNRILFYQFSRADSVSRRCDRGAVQAR